MSAKKYPRWAPAVGAVVVLTGAMLLSNQNAPTQDGKPLAITSQGEYEATRVKMEGLSMSRLQANEAGKKLTPDDLNKLREAGDLVDKMTDFDPTLTGLYFLSGKIHAVLGENSIAEEKFLQATLVADQNIAKRPDEAQDIRFSVAESNYQLSLLRMAHGDVKGSYAAADAAAKSNGRSSLYLTARASALNEMRRTDEAKRDLIQALKIDPTNRRALTLLNFISKG